MLNVACRTHDQTSVLQQDRKALWSTWRFRSPSNGWQGQDKMRLACIDRRSNHRTIPLVKLVFPPLECVLLRGNIMFVP